MITTDQCIKCGSTNLIKKGTTNTMNILRQRYKCKDCGVTFAPPIKDKINKERHKYIADINCPYCGQHTVIKNGHNDSKTQKYKCNTCNKSFTDNTLKVKCTKCGSYEVKRRSIVNNKQRYICKECGTTFRLYSKNEPKDARSIIYQANCPHCGNNKATRKGLLKDGRSCYLCTKCGKRFLSEYKYLDATQKEALRNDYINNYTTAQLAYKYNITKTTVEGYVRGLRTKRLNNSKDKKENTNNEFKKSKALKPKIKTKQIDNQIEKTKQARCKKILELKLKQFQKKYEQELQRQQYILEGLKKREEKRKQKEQLILQEKLKKQKLLIEKQKQYIKDHLKEFVKKDIFNGISEQTVLQKYNITKTQLNTICRYGYSKETLTQEQRNTIYKYGVLLSVPVDYLAPYIPCSQKICNKVLSKYVITKLAPYERTETEIHLDNYILDKFTGLKKPYNTKGISNE